MIGQSKQNVQGHVPVMLREVLDALLPQDGGVYVDATFGAGGYTRGILAHADCTVYAIDRDPDAIERAHDMAKELSGKLIPLEGCFGDMQSLLQEQGVEQVDGIVLDIGVSSFQIDQPERGFSFQTDGPLDMRMSKSGQSAADVVNDTPETELANIIFQFGEERASRRIAKAIVAARTEERIETTRELTKIIHGVLPMHGGLRTDTATRTFQALRIYVNDELGELDRALDAGEALLETGGRLVVVAFHSLEDSRVKRFLRQRSGKGETVSRHMPVLESTYVPTFSMKKNSALKASEAEIKINPRSRSARLRCGIRTEAEVSDA